MAKEGAEAQVTMATEAAEAQATAAEEEAESHKVLIAVDDSPQAEAAFDWYCSRIHHKKNKLMLVTVGNKASVSGSGQTPKEVKKAEKEDALQKKFNAKMETHGVEGAFRLLHNAKAGEALVQEAKNENVAYIFMGTRGRGAISRTFGGSVSDYVLHNSSCPVFICKV